METVTTRDAEWFFSPEGEDAYNSATSLDKKVAYFFEYLSSLNEENDECFLRKLAYIMADAMVQTRLPFAGWPHILSTDTNPLIALVRDGQLLDLEEYGLDVKKDDCKNDNNYGDDEEGDEEDDEEDAGADKEVTKELTAYLECVNGTSILAKKGNASDYTVNMLLCALHGTPLHKVCFSELQIPDQEPFDQELYVIEREIIWLFCYTIRPKTMIGPYGQGESSAEDAAYNDAETVAAGIAQKKAAIVNLSKKRLVWEKELYEINKASEEANWKKTTARFKRIVCIVIVAIVMYTVGSCVFDEVKAHKRQQETERQIQEMQQRNIEKQATEQSTPRNSVESTPAAEDISHGAEQLRKLFDYYGDARDLGYIVAYEEDGAIGVAPCAAWRDLGAEGYYYFVEYDQPGNIWYGTKSSCTLIWENGDPVLNDDIYTDDNAADAGEQSGEETLQRFFYYYGGGYALDSDTVYLGNGTVDGFVCAVWQDLRNPENYFWVELSYPYRIWYGGANDMLPVICEDGMVTDNWYIGDPVADAWEDTGGENAERPGEDTLREYFAYRSDVALSTDAVYVGDGNVDGNLCARWKDTKYSNDNYYWVELEYPYRVWYGSEGDNGVWLVFQDGMLAE